MRSGEPLQLPQKLALYFPQAEQDLRMDPALLQRHQPVAVEHAAGPQGIHQPNCQWKSTCCELPSELILSRRWPFAVFSWTPSGCRARVRTQLIWRTSDQLSIIRVVASLDFTIPMRTPRDIWVRSSPFTSNAQSVSDVKSFAASSATSHLWNIFRRHHHQHWVQSLGSQHQTRPRRQNRIGSLRTDDWLDRLNSNSKPFCHLKDIFLQRTPEITQRSTATRILSNWNRRVF